MFLKMTGGFWIFLIILHLKGWILDKLKKSKTGCLKIKSKNVKSNLFRYFYNILVSIIYYVGI